MIKKNSKKIEALMSKVNDKTGTTEPERNSALKMAVKLTKKHGSCKSFGKNKVFAKCTSCNGVELQVCKHLLSEYESTLKTSKEETENLKDKAKNTSSTKPKPKKSKVRSATWIKENTRSVNNKRQQRSCGARKEKNAYGHFFGTIGAKIDKLIENGCFTKAQIMNYAGTKMSKVNSHICHLRKDKNCIVNAPRGGVVSFG